MNAEYFVTYEQALALKNLGFREPCLYFYTEDHILEDNCYYGNEVYVRDLEASHNEHNLATIDAPTLAQAQAWIRNAKHHHVSPMYIGNQNWVAIIYNMDDDNKNIKMLDRKSSYEEALSAGITEYLRNIQ